MGVGVSVLLQFSLTSGGYPSVGRSRRSSRRSIPGNIPRRSWAKPHLQLHSLQGSSYLLSSLTELLRSSDVTRANSRNK
ncbi:hypothetical protein FD755_012651 [Muntiacus reevesi]|uniref:Uncharacterized protein n=2 Tax=Muntiacus TaxID=9885 RepID=A0A5N3XQT0_MUNRE|nr:hypothetical protein FD754_021667 [Muntiacus muntjak]KAB0376008.1 hypothetical protein FD755_012651 [Muntiacus reevesi]